MGIQPAAPKRWSFQASPRALDLIRWPQPATPLASLRCAHDLQIFCNAAQNFGKEWQTARVCGFTRNEGRQPRKQTPNKEMETRNMVTLHLRKINDRSPLRHGFLLIPLLLACFATVFISATTPAVASDQVPFKGTVSGQIPEDMGPPVPGSGACVFNFFVSNVGNATQLGHFTGTSNFIPNVCDGSYTGTFNWIAANGDTITGPFFGQLIPTATPGLFDNTETAIITGGTGRFSGASGMLTLSGQVNFVTHSFVLPWQGTISKPSR